jgi:hypothetical protein
MNMHREQLEQMGQAFEPGFWRCRSQRIAAPALLAVGMLASAWAGNKTSVTADGWGKVESSVSYSAPVAVASFSALAAPPPDSSLKEAKNPPPQGTDGTTQVNIPNAGVNPSGTFTGVVTNLPSGCPSSVYCTVTTTLLSGGYKAIVRSYVTGGAVADNDELEELLPDLAEPNCASYSVTNDVVVLPGTTTGELIITGEASDGTAIRLEGYELPKYEYGNVYFDNELEQEVRDGPSQEEIRNGSKKYSILLRGPFNYTAGCPLRIPFTYSGKPENLHTTIDAIAKSTPFEVICPSEPLVLGCDEVPGPVNLEVAGGCGNVTTELIPPLNQLPPGNSWVTVIARDEVGNVATCQFEVTRGVLEFHGFYPPIGGSSATGNSGSCASPLRRINAGNKIPIKFDATVCGVPYTPDAPPTVAIYAPGPNCGETTTPVLVGEFQQVANEWHFNWQTKPSDKGKFKIVVDVNNGGHTEAPFAWIELR